MPIAAEDPVTVKTDHLTRGGRAMLILGQRHMFHARAHLTQGIVYLLVLRSPGAILAQLVHDLVPLLGHEVWALVRAVSGRGTPPPFRALIRREHQPAPLAQ